MNINYPTYRAALARPQYLSLVQIPIILIEIAKYTQLEGLHACAHAINKSSRKMLNINIVFTWKF